jgi:uncharacterized membrane protein
MLTAAGRHLSNVLFVLIAIMVLTGGHTFRGAGWRFEMSQVSPWALVLLALILATRDRGWTGEAWRRVADRCKRAEFSVKAAFALIGGVAFLLFVAHVFKHANLRTDGADVSFVHQPLFYPWSDGRWFRTALLSSGNALEGHLAYTFILLAPLTSLFKSDELIFAIQALFLFGPLVLLLRHGPLEDKKSLWLFAAFLFVSHRALRNATVFDFREDAIAYAGFVLMALSLLHGRIVAYFAALLLAVLSKENMFAVALMFVVPILFSREIPLDRRARRAVAIGTVVLCLAYGVLAFKVLIPMYTGPRQGQHPVFARYAQYGSTVPEIMLTLLTSPSAWWALFKQTITWGGIRYLVMVVGPLAMLLRTRESWLWLAPAAPGLLMNITHTYGPQRMMIFHYELIILPFLFLGALFGARTIPSVRDTRWFWVLLVALCFSDRWPMQAIQEHFPTRSHWQASRFLNDLDERYSVAINTRLSAQVNHLREHRIVEGPTPGTLPPTDRWVLDQRRPEEKARTEALLTQGYREISRDPGGTVVLMDLTEKHPR